jgi:hypothetical protein
MDPSLKQSLDQLLQSVSVEQNISALALGAYLILGGIMAVYIRFLYRLCGASPNDAESITRVFPLLTLVTIGVIAVVKSSMALSLGLVGALSIVRFRAAIKEPEELVYLFLCIGVGLSLGASQPLIAVVLLLVASLFIFSLHFARRGRRNQQLLLTVSGDAARYFSESETSALRVIDQVVRHYSLQRLDVENQRGQVRVVFRDAGPQATSDLLQQLRERLPDCELSYVNLQSSW